MGNIIVIGGGLMGASVAWQLASRGADVTLLEQQDEHYLHGSSYGNARISRSLGPKKDVYSYVHNQTVKEVKKLIGFLNGEGSDSAHKMDDVYSTSPVSYFYSRDQYYEIKRLKHKKQKNDFARASQRSAFRKFGMSIPDNSILVRERREYSGTLNPEQLIRKLRVGILQKGGKVQYGHKVVGLTKVDSLFMVEVLDKKTNKTHTAKAAKIVMAAGPYIPQILRDYAPYMDRVVTPKKVAVSFLKIADERFAQLTEGEKKALYSGFPYFSQIGKEYYALITDQEEGKSPVIKAGGHNRRRNIHDLDNVWSENPQKKELKWIKKQFRKHMKMFEIQLSKKDIEEVKSYHCVYAESRSGSPLVTHIFNRHGSVDRDIVMIGGMSGIGAKGCLCYGSLGADLLMGKNDKPNKMYRKMIKTFANPSVNLHTRRARPGMLF